MFCTRSTKLILVLLSIAFSNYGETCVCAQEDFVLENVYEAALDLPRILFLLKREPSSPPLKPRGHFEVNCAFLDTGASGIVLSRETATIMGLAIDSKARFADIGENHNIASRHPDTVKRLQNLLERHVDDLEKNSRPAAFVENPKPIIPFPEQR
jgi:hypothetical protein